MVGTYLCTYDDFEIITKQINAFLFFVNPNYTHILQVPAFHTYIFNNTMKTVLNYCTGKQRITVQKTFF